MKLLPVIIAGGAGQRLWPLSTPQRPKPFADILGDGTSLFARTVERATAIPYALRPLAVCNQAHELLVREATSCALLLEPEPRDTAPAICAAALWAMQRHGYGVMLCVMPADHLILDVRAFAETITHAAAAARDDRIVTVAIVPTRAATDFGYIHMGEGKDGFHEVQAFIEKPAAERAAQLIAGPNFWNAGIFVATAGTLLKAFASLTPDILAACSKALQDGTAHMDAAAFSSARKISFDYAVMEKHTAVAAVKATFDWQDLGTWSAVHAVSDRNSDGNSGIGDSIFWRSRNCLLRAETAALSALHCESLAAIEQGRELLVMPLALSGALRNAMKLPRKNLAPGASMTVDASTCGGKLLVSNPGDQVMRVVLFGLS